MINDSTLRFRPRSLRCVCSSCMVGPRYQRPTASTPPPEGMVGNDQWKMATPSDGLLKGNWWETFGDPQLNALEDLVDINNQNVKQAEAEFRQARAAGPCQSRGLLSLHRIDAGDHRRGRKRQGSRRRRDLFPAGHRDLGAGSVGPGSLVG